MVGVLCATKGEKGTDRLGRGLTMNQMAAERAAEFKVAAKILKLSYVQFYNYPDGGLDKAPFKLLVAKLKQQIETLQPKIILTFGPEGVTGHRDHVAIGKAAIAASKTVKNKPQEIWLASMPRSKIKSFRAHMIKRKVHHTHYKEKVLQGVPDKQLKIIPTGKYKRTKLKAIKAHKSQFLSSLVTETFLNREYFQVIKLK